MSMHYYSCLGGPSAVSIKSALGHVTPNLCFTSSVIYRPCSAFYFVRAAKCRLTPFHARVVPVWIRQKARQDTLRRTCVFASGASGTRNIDALFVMLRWARCCFHKKRTETRYARLVFSASGGICGSRSAFRCFQAVNHRCIIFFAQVGPVRFPQKSHRDTLHLTCLFTSGGIYWSRSAFWCIRAVKHRRNIFHAWFGLVQFP
jgi:hypothetical protein